MDKAKVFVLTIHELLFALNLAFATVAWDSSRENSRFIGAIAGPVREFIPESVAAPLGISATRPNALVDFLAAWCVLAVLVYACTFFLAHTSGARIVLGFAPPVVAAEGMPLFWILCGGLTVWLGRGAYWWLVSEGILILGFIIYCMWRRWPAKRAVVSVVFAFHFGLWGWLTWNPNWFRLWIIYPLLGFLSIVAWECYLA